MLLTADDRADIFNADKMGLDAILESSVLLNRSRSLARSGA